MTDEQAERVEPCPFCGHTDWTFNYEADERGYPMEECGHCGYRSMWANGQMMREFPDVKPILVRLITGNPTGYEVVLPPGVIGTFKTMPETEWQAAADHARLQFVAKKIADAAKPYSFRVASDFEDEYHYVVSTAIAEFLIPK
jgi:hypothetical protein